MLHTTCEYLQCMNGSIPHEWKRFASFLRFYYRLIEVLNDGPWAHVPLSLDLR